MKRLPRFIIWLLLFPTVGFACFPCMPLGIENPVIQIFSRENQRAVSNAEAGLFLTKNVDPGYKSPVELTCLSDYGIGEKLWSGKTQTNGEIDLRSLKPGTYWMAIKSKNEEAVYVIIPAKEYDPNEKWKLEISEGGLVNNKCGVEPIDLFFH